MDFSNRHSRLELALAEEGIDALLVTHLPNIRYLCGFTGSSGVLAVVAGKQARFFTDGRYTQQAKEEVKSAQVKISSSNALMGASEWLKGQKRGLRVGFESEHMTVATRAALSKARPDLKLVATCVVIERLRAVKDSVEIAQIRAAVNLASSVFEAVLPEIKPGVREAGIAAQIEYLSRGLGAEGMSFETLVAAGKRSAMPHGVAGQSRLPDRGFCILDFGVILGGYCSDMTRTVHLGPPNKTARTIYKAVLDAQLAGIQIVKAGVKCSEVDYAARKVLEKAGLGMYFTHSTGHGVGLEIHEAPGIRKSARTVKSGQKSRNRMKKQAGIRFDTLQPGMVITIEPGVYIPGEGGVRIEDMVVVTGGGCEVLTPTKKDLIVIQ